MSDSINFVEGMKLIAVKYSYRNNSKPKIINVTLRVVNSPNGIIRTAVDDNNNLLTRYDLGDVIKINSYTYYDVGSEFLLFTNKLNAYEDIYYRIRSKEILLENDIFEIETKLRKAKLRYLRNRRVLNKLLEAIKELKRK